MSSELWALLPLLGFGGIVLWELSIRASLVEALLRSTIWWVAGVWVLANGLSQFSWLHPAVLRGTWLVAGSALAGTGIWRFIQTRKEYFIAWPRLRGWELVFGLAGGILVGLALITAIFSPPVTVDVLNYHLPRQLMWLQQGSLAHFITVNDRALMMPPMAEVISLQFLGLTGNDTWVNLPQFSAYALLPLVVGKIARRLGASRTAAVFGAWLVLCLPMAYHEASNAKNDLQEAFWIALLAWRVVEAGIKPRVCLIDAVLVGLILALALLTKSTAFLFVPPLLVLGWWGWHHVAGAKMAWRRTLVAGVISLLMVAPFFARNLAWYGSPLGVHQAEDGGHQANEAFTPKLIASNAIRNAVVHLAAPWPAWNSLLLRGVSILHGWLGLSVDDPRNTLWVLGFSIEYMPKEETKTAAPFHLLAILIAVMMALGLRRARAWRGLAGSVLCMGLLFCLVLKWQPWGARLELPIFVLGSVLVAGITDIWSTGRSMAWFAGLGLLGALIWWPGREEASRPLWTTPTIFSTSRNVNMYRYLPLLRERDSQLVTLLKAAEIRNVAIVSIHDIPYAFMREMQRVIPDVHFYGAPASDSAGPAEAYVCLALLRPMGLNYVVNDVGTYRLVGAGAGDGIYLPVEKVKALGWGRKLPDFAGWSWSEGIQIGVDMPTLTGSAQYMRYLPTGECVLDFQAEGERAYLSALVMNSAAIPTELVFEINSVAVEPAHLSAPDGYARWEVTLPCRKGPNRLVIHCADNGKREVTFTRLVINDFPPAAEHTDQ
ncbi:MAG: glycosyltransferase family 39 protein [Cephaloticoccus sp.]|nr:glycosyltransferase family 39 protein [Cephaloticoccus sp.]